MSNVLTDEDSGNLAGDDAAFAGGVPSDSPASTVPAAPTITDQPAMGGAPPAAPQQQVQPPAGHADPHSMIGRAFRAIKNSLEGTQTVYTPDPTTGAVQESQVSRKPGQIFRDIIAGAMVGGAAAGSQLHEGTPNPLSGAFRGGEAELAYKQDQNHEQREQAQQTATKLKSSYDQQQKQKQANDMQAAQVAQATISGLEFDQHSNMYDPKQIMSHNNSSELVKSQILNNGGVTPHIAGADGGELNGKPGNGDALMKLYTADPTKVMAAPQGFHRVHLASVNTEGLERKGSTWVDPKTGKEVDLADRTTHYLMDLPTTAWNKTMPLTNGTINDVAGYNIAQGKPTDTRQVDFGSLFGLRLKNIQQLNSERADLYPNLKNQYAFESFQAKAQAVKNNPDSSPEDREKADKQLDYAADVLKAHKDWSPEKTTATDLKLQTENLNKKLAAFSTDGGPDLTPDERATLVQRQKEESNKGVPADIVAAIGTSKPVPAEFPLGEKDPRYIKASQWWGKASLDKKTALAAASGVARYQMLGKIKEQNVIDTVGNKLLTMNSNDLNAANQQSPGRYVLATAGDGTKAVSKVTALKDVQDNIDSVRQSYKALDTLSEPDRLLLVKALSAPDHSVMDDYLTGLARRGATSEQQQAIVDLTSLMEQVQAIPNVLGIKSNSDMSRKLVLNMVPGAATIGVQGYGDKVLDRLQRSFNQVSSGVPVPGQMTTETVSGGRPPKRTTVKMKAPNGQVNDVTADQVAHYKSLGAVEVTDDTKKK